MVNIRNQTKELDIKLGLEQLNIIQTQITYINYHPIVNLKSHNHLIRKLLVVSYTIYTCSVVYDTG